MSVKLTRLFPGGRAWNLIGHTVPRNVMTMSRPSFMDGPGSEALRQRCAGKGNKCGPSPDVTDPPRFTDKATVS